MDHGKLFRILVIGGAVLGAGCLETATPAGPEDAGARDAGAEGVADAGSADGGSAEVADAGSGETDSGVATPPDAGELMECGICPNVECCETDESGASHERPGLVCCWGTSC